MRRNESLLVARFDAEPQGSSEGGRWTSEGGGAGDGTSHQGTGDEPAAGSGRSDPRVLSDATPYNYYKPGAQLAQNEPQKQYSVNLAEEERRGGHTLRDHVGKTDEELMAVMRTDRGDAGIFGYVRQRQGSFESQESANDFVNRTLEQNKSLVDEVASGNKEKDFATARFGYITGREAYRPPNEYAQPYLRNTYGVGVGIIHDPSSVRGYRVYTAYPRND
ncbi:MAG: hypothetical protein HYX37_04165 [Rhizobiales bacterium]|nr:hypothetical protein [Hyphomicrobiales bacterium]